MKRLLASLAAIVVIALAATALVLALRTDPRGLPRELASVARPRSAVPGSTALGIPEDGETGVVAGEIGDAGFSHGEGRIEISTRIRIDGHPVWESVLLDLGPDSWLRVPSTEDYVPLKAVLEKGEHLVPRMWYLSQGTALRAVVLRKGDHLVVLSIEPFSAVAAAKHPAQRDSVGKVDFSGSIELTGVARGGSWDDDPGRPFSTDFSTLTRDGGVPVRVSAEVAVPWDVRLHMNGRRVDVGAAGADLGMDPGEAFSTVLTRSPLRAHFSLDGPRLVMDDIYLRSGIDHGDEPDPFDVLGGFDD